MTRTFSEMAQALYGGYTRMTTVRVESMPMDAMWVGHGFVVSRRVYEVETAMGYETDQKSSVSIGFKDPTNKIDWVHGLRIGAVVRVDVPV